MYPQSVTQTSIGFKTLQFLHIEKSVGTSITPFADQDKSFFFFQTI